MSYPRSLFALLCLLGCACLLAPTAVQADEAEAIEVDVAGELTKLLGANPGARASALWTLTASGASPADVLDALPEARQRAGGERVDGESPVDLDWTHEVAPDREHTVFARIPSSYDPAKPLPLLVWLHGGVSREPDGGGASGMQVFGAEAEAEGYALLCPSGRAGAVWWDEAGTKLILDAIDKLAQHVHIDARRIAVAGFSDGASGCYHLMAHAPDRFCCFIPMHGHPGLTRVLYGPAFTSNVRGRRAYATNGEVDQLYPSGEVQGMIQELKDAGCLIDWHDIAGSGHSMNGLEGHWNAARALWLTNERPAEAAGRIDWATTKPDFDGRHEWIAITALDANAPATDEDLDTGTLPTPPQRARIGFQIDQTHQGAGVAVGPVSEGSAATEADLREGDVILEAGGHSLDGDDRLQRLGALLGSYDPEGEAGIDLVVDRDGERLEITVHPKVPPLPEPYQRPRGHVRAIWEAGEATIETKGVRTLRLYLTPEQADGRRSLQVTWNGQVVHDGSVAPDLTVTLDEIVRAGSGISPYVAALDLTVPTPDPEEDGDADGAGDSGE